MNQYNLIYPKNNKIYYGTDSKSVATKIFRNLAKYKNIDQSRIIIEENNSKKKYHFVGMTNNKLNKYSEILNKLNINHIGGGLTEKIDDNEFLKKLSELSGNINLSVDELIKILKTKYDPDSESVNGENIITVVNNGIEKLDVLNKNVSGISTDLTAIRKVISPVISTGTESKNAEKSGGFCTIM
tara:strand:- start:2 stop:556 length:555 start_codon:yes stop_codon:yes gene_type:complete